VHTLEEQSSVEMKCQFVSDDFKLFDNPIVWRKRQGSEESQVNMMGNLLEPFAMTQRYKASYTPGGANHDFRLNIKDVTLEDAGNYSCEVSGPQNSVVASVTHRVNVKSRVDSIVISTAGNETNLIGQQKSLIFIEGQPVDLTCTVIGGNPPPDVDVYLGNNSADERLVPGFELNRTTDVTGQKGLRRVHHMTVWTVPRYVPQSHDDGKEMRCVATVHMLESTQVRATVLVQYAPLVECDMTEAAIGDRNVNLRCLVRARPPCHGAHWVIDDNGTTVSEGEVVNEHWQLVMDLTNGQFEVQLYIRYVTAQSFRNYTLRVENRVSSTSTVVTLKQRLPRLGQYVITQEEEHPGKQEAAHQSYTSGAAAILNDHHVLLGGRQSKAIFILISVLMRNIYSLCIRS